MTRFDRGPDLIRRHRRAHDRGRHVQPPLVTEPRRLAQGRPGLSYGPLPEGRQLLIAEARQAAAACFQLLPRGQRQLGGLEVRFQGAGRGPGIDVDQGRDLARNAVARRVAGNTCPAVHCEHYRDARRGRRLADRLDVVGQGDRGPVGARGFQSRQRDRGDVKAVGAQRRGDVVPRPGAQPESGHEHYRSGSHTGEATRQPCAARLLSRMITMGYVMRCTGSQIVVQSASSARGRAGA